MKRRIRLFVVAAAFTLFLVFAFSPTRHAQGSENRHGYRICQAACAS